jgi:hypothetical protein
MSWKNMIFASILRFWAKTGAEGLKTHKKHSRGCGNYHSATCLQSSNKGQHCASFVLGFFTWAHHGRKLSYMTHTVNAVLLSLLVGSIKPERTKAFSLATYEWETKLASVVQYELALDMPISSKYAKKTCIWLGNKNANFLWVKPEGKIKWAEQIFTI